MKTLIQITDTILIQDGGEDYVVSILTDSNQNERHAKRFYFISLEQALEEAYDVAIKQGLATSERKDLQSTLTTMTNVHQKFCATVQRLSTELDAQYKAVEGGREAKRPQGVTMPTTTLSEAQTGFAGKNQKEKGRNRNQLISVTD